MSDYRPPYGLHPAKQLSMKACLMKLAWRFGFIKNIPLNELPDRLKELAKGKLIVTVCPHCDRAEIARTYLTLQGYRSRYLVEGLLGLAEYLRGDRAKSFIDDLRVPGGREIFK